jgi:hypothetical protein
MNCSVEKLIKMKKLNEKIIFLFKNLIDGTSNAEEDIYNSLNNLLHEHGIFEENFINLKRSEINNEYSTFIQIQKHINKKIIEQCKHEFVEDDIDLTSDRSMKITYCKICENNLDDCKNSK